MNREMKFEELPPNSWQRDAFEKGFVFYGEPNNPNALNDLQNKIDTKRNNESNYNDALKNIDSNVGKIAIAEQINCEFDPRIQDRYAHFIAS